MSDSSGSRQLPANPSLERLRKDAKQHLKSMRLDCSGASLADAQFALARRYGFASWRALKEEVERCREAAATPVPNMGTFLPRPAAAAHWLQDAGSAEQVFSPLSALSLLVLQPLAPFALHLLR